MLGFSPLASTPIADSGESSASIVVTIDATSLFATGHVGQLAPILSGVSATGGVGQLAPILSGVSATGSVQAPILNGVSATWLLF